MLRIVLRCCFRFPLSDGERRGNVHIGHLLAVIQGHTGYRLHECYILPHDFHSGRSVPLSRVSIAALSSKLL